MDYCKKIIILNNISSKTSKVTLCLEQIGTSLTGEVKFFDYEVKSNLVLGIMLGGFILTPIELKKHHNLKQGFRFSLNGKLDLSSEISAIIGIRDGAKAVPVFYGSNFGKNENKFDAVINKIAGGGNIGFVSQTVVAPVSRLYETNEQEIETQIDEELKQDYKAHEELKPAQEPDKQLNEDYEVNEQIKQSYKTHEELNQEYKQEDKEADTCPVGPVYEEFIFPTENLAQHNVEEFIFPTESLTQHSVEDFIFPTENVKERAEFVFENDEPAPPSFFNLISADLDTLFLTYPEEQVFYGVFPNSKFVRVDYNGNGLFYCVGIIYGENEPTEIVYAVPAKQDAPIPPEATENAKWMPLPYTTKAGKTYDGFYVMHQSAVTGETI